APRDQFQYDDQRSGSRCEAGAAPATVSGDEDDKATGALCVTHRSGKVSSEVDPGARRPAVVAMRSAPRWAERAAIAVALLSRGDGRTTRTPTLQRALPSTAARGRARRSKVHAMKIKA